MTKGINDIAAAIAGDGDKPVAVAALIRKRADVLFEIGQAEREAERLRTELVHLDAVIRMFRPEFTTDELPTRKSRPTKCPYFKHGELTQRIYDALRTAETITGRDVAVAAMTDKGLDPVNDQTTRTDFVRRVGLALNSLQRKGKIDRIGKGSALRWKLAPGEPGVI
jgi:hypothetical protein